MANVSNQFYYVDNGKPILKTEYDDGSEDFYDASGQFNGYSWSGVNDGTVIDPYGDMAQQEADKQAGKANREAQGTGGQSYAPPGGSSQMSNPLKPRQQQNVDDPSSHSVQTNQAPGYSPPPGMTPANPNMDSSQYQKDMSRYDWAGNPKGAMMNALTDLGQGGRPISLLNNPYVDRLMLAAPGLATSFMGQHAAQGGGAYQGNSFGDFGSFLRNAIQNGSVFSTLQGAQGMMPGMVNQVRDYNKAGRAGGDPSADILQNPFIQQLAAMFSADSGNGALASQASLYSPMMTGAMQGPFSDMLQSRGTNAQGNWYQQGDPLSPNMGGNDWFKYLFGY